jgi:hypothetical protein
MMGQELLNPPTVEGWHTGREWIDSSFLIERVNFAADMLGDTETPGMRRMTERVAAGRSEISPDELVDACLYELGCVELESRTRDILVAEVGLPDPIPINEQFEDRVSQVIELLVATREFQLS